MVILKQKNSLIYTLLLAAILIAIYVLAVDGVDTIITINNPANGTATNISGNLSSFVFNCTFVTNNTGTVSNVTLYFSRDPAPPSLNVTNTSGIPNATDGLFNFTVIRIAEGIYHWTCGSGNTSGTFVSNAGNRTITFDSTSPHTINLTNPGPSFSTTTLNALPFEFNASDALDQNLTCDVRLDGVLNVTRTVLNSSNVTDNRFNISGIPDGDHSWNITCRDDANNSNVSATNLFTVDAVRPVDPVHFLIGADAPTNGTATKNTSSFVFNCTYATNNSGAINNATLFFARGPSGAPTLNATNATGVANNTQVNFTVTNIAEGVYYWACGAGNSSQPYVNNSLGTANRTITFDGTGPHTINLTNPGPNFNTSTLNALPFEFNASDALDQNLTCDVRLDGVLNVTRTVLNSSNVTDNRFNISGIPDGDHSWNITCTDDAGNSNVSATNLFTVDAVRPVDPVHFLIGAVGPGNGTVTNGTSAAFNCTFVTNNSGAVNNATLFFSIGPSGAPSLNVTNATGVANNTQFNFTVNNIAEGKYYWACGAGNSTQPYVNNSQGTANRTITFDRTAPYTINLTNPGPNFNTSTLNALPFEFNATDAVDTNLTCDVRLDGVINVTRTVLNSSNVTDNRFNISGIADGDHSWNITCRDDAGNSNISATNLFTVDAVPPVDPVHFIILANNPANATVTNRSGNGANFTFNCTVTTNNSGAINNATLFFGRGPSGAPAFNATNATGVANNTLFNFTVVNIAEGIYYWACGAGNSSQPYVNNSQGLANRTITFDSTPPHTINLTNPGSNFNTSTLNALPFEFNASDALDQNLTCDVRLDGVLNVTRTVLNSSNVTDNRFNISGIPDGYHYWNITCRDDANNSNVSATNLFYVDNTAPTVILVHPRNGSWFQNKTNPIQFNYTVGEFSNGGCELWGNLSSASFTQNQSTPITTNQSVSGSTTNFTALVLTEGTYFWNVNCSSNGRNRFNTSNGTFTVDLTPPSITIAVSKASLAPGETETITCTATDNLDTSPNVSITSVDTPNGVSGDTDGTFTDTSTSGTYTANCRATDIAGSVTTISKQFTVTESGGSSGSGGGGGGGGAGGAAVSTSSNTFSKVTANEPIEAKVSNSESGVDVISLTSNEDLSNVKISVSELSESPVVTSVSGTVFKYVEIKATNAPDDKLKSIVVKFHVDKAWLADNDANAEDVALSRYVNGIWKKLVTEKLSEDADKIYFKASSGGFSYYAITVKQKEALAEPTVEEEAAETPAVTPPEEVIVQKEAKPSRKWLWAVLGLFAVGAIAIGVYLKQRNKGFKR